MSCPSCGGWVLFKPVCSLVSEHSIHRCRCLDTPMERVAWAFTWLGYFIGQRNAMLTPLPFDPREA